MRWRRPRGLLKSSLTSFQAMCRGTDRARHEVREPKEMRLKAGRRGGHRVSGDTRV